MRRIALLLALSSLVGIFVPAAEARPKTHTVIMEGMRFQPASLTVKSGDTIVWVNKDVVAHTATSIAFDSAIIRPGKSWKYTVQTKGALEYVCTLHPAMKGALRVR